MPSPLVILDIRKPMSRKSYIESLRQATVQALDQLQQALNDLAANTASTDDLYGLVDTVMMLVTQLQNIADDLGPAAENAAAAHKLLQTNIDAEAGTRAAAITDLVNRLTAEIAARTTGDQVSSKAASDEAARALAAEQTLATGLASEASSRQAADSAEAGARVNADTALGARIDAEVSARQQADLTEAATRAKADSDETARAKAAEGTLTANLAAEVTRATGAEQALTTNLNAEVTARTKGDSDEAATRKAADDALTARVTALEALHLRGTTGTDSVTSIVAAGSVNRTVTLKAAMPNAKYLALPVIDTTSGINLSTVSVIVTAQTATTVTTQVKNSGVGLLQTLNYTILAIDLS